MAQGDSQSFDLLHERVRHWIWKQNWTELRDIQEEAIRVLIEQKNDVLISSATASGKTEAAFLPIASVLAGASDDGFGVLNVSPLKALINDQYERLRGLFDELEIPVYRWHGDVAASMKRAAIERPSGLLLITPESLEALFVRRGSSGPRLFRKLRFIVVDELHAFIGTERGRQLQSLLHRVESASGRTIPRVALSATLGDLDLAAEFLRPKFGREVHRITSQLGRKEVKIQVRAYQTDRLRHELAADEEESIGSDMVEIQEHIYHTCRGGRHIIFANRRADVEMYADRLRVASEANRVPNEFWPHHGSLDKGIRQDAEAALKDGTRPATVVATSTLELGIDVGSVESIGQIGPPSSVASLRQRLGRSGRRGAPAVLRIYVSESPIDPRTPPQDRIRTGLVQSIAVVQLLIQRWCEAPRPGALHLSTLVQQILSIIAERGGIRADAAYELLCRRGPFDAVSTTVFAQLLRCLAEHDLIQQIHTGELVMGLAGERLVGHYDFYSAFTTSEEYRLTAAGRTLGSLPIANPLVEGHYLIFAGRRWKILSVDVERKVVELEPAPGGRTPSFGGSGALVDGTIRKQMRLVYNASEVPTFVDQASAIMLSEARLQFKNLNLDTKEILSASPDVLIFPWLGDRALGTLALLLMSRGIVTTIEPPALCAKDCDVGSVERVFATLTDVESEDSMRLVQHVRNKVLEKHHRFLDERLLALDYVSSHVDLAGVAAWIAGRK